jgi:hypothetical protein
VLISVVGYWFDAADRCGTLRGPATAKYVAAQPLAAARGRATWDHASPTMWWGTLDRGSHNPPGAPPVTQRVCRNQAEPSLPHNSNRLHSADPCSVELPKPLGNGATKGMLFWTRVIYNII